MIIPSAAASIHQIREWLDRNIRCLFTGDCSGEVHASPFTARRGQSCTSLSLAPLVSGHSRKQPLHSGQVMRSPHWSQTWCSPEILRAKFYRCPFLIFLTRRRTQNAPKSIRHPHLHHAYTALDTAEGVSRESDRPKSSITLCSGALVVATAGSFEREPDLLESSEWLIVLSSPLFAALSIALRSAALALGRFLYLYRAVSPAYTWYRCAYRASMPATFKVPLFTPTVCGALFEKACQPRNLTLPHTHPSPCLTIPTHPRRRDLSIATSLAVSLPISIHLFHTSMLPE